MPEKGKNGLLLRKIYDNNVTIRALEKDRERYESLKKEGTYDSIDNADVTDWIRGIRGFFDVIIFGDILEHLPSRAHVFEVLDHALNHFRHLVITVPIRHIGPGHRTVIWENDFDEFDLLREKHIVSLKHKLDWEYTKMSIWLDNHEFKYMNSRIFRSKLRIVRRFCQWLILLYKQRRVLGSYKRK